MFFSKFKRIFRAFFRAFFRPFRKPFPAQSNGAKNIHLATGIWGEKIAAEFLMRKGFKIVGKRVRILRDEIDIIASSPLGIGGMNRLVFVEVKTRASEIFGGGIAAVDKRKRRILNRAAIRYLRDKPKTAFRFDIVEIIGVMGSDTPPKIRHFENAFNLDTRYYYG